MLVFECQSPGKALDAAFDPILEMGHLEVTPVMKRD